MQGQTGPRTHGARPGFHRVVAWLLAFGLLLGALPLRAWAAAAPVAPPALAEVLVEVLADTQALPPCHGEPGHSASHPQADADARHTTAPAGGLCDCCLSCSPAAAGALPLALPASPALGGPPASAPVPPIQALPDGLFRPPRA